MTPFSTNSTIDKPDTLQLRELDKPGIRFAKIVMGLPRSAPIAATLLDLGMASVYSKAICRAVNYWAKLSKLPGDHIMQHCLQYQREIIDCGAKPWLYYVQNLLAKFGMGYILTLRRGRIHIGQVKQKFKTRVEDTLVTELKEECYNKRSLGYFRDRLENNNLRQTQKYTSYGFTERRVMGHMRMNLKYSLPIDFDSGVCKLCLESVEDGDYWSHVLDYCPSIPHTASGNYVMSPFPFCTDAVIRDSKHPYFNRIRFSLQ